MSGPVIEPQVTVKAVVYKNAAEAAAATKSAESSTEEKDK